MPHRDPMLAALARGEQLRARIGELDPRAGGGRPRVQDTLAAILSENARLERLLADLERPASTPSEVEGEEELAAVVREDEAERLGEPPVDDTATTRARQRRRLLLTMGVLAPVAAMVILAEIDVEPRHGTTPAREKTTVHLSGVVVSRAGSIDVKDGERCAITIVDSGDREAGRLCTIDIVCSNVTQGFFAASCPIGKPNEAVGIETNGLTIDTAKRTATFLVGGKHWELTQGGATLRLDPTH